MRLWGKNRWEFYQWIHRVSLLGSHRSLCDSRQTYKMYSLMSNPTVLSITTANINNYHLLISYYVWSTKLSIFTQYLIWTPIAALSTLSSGHYNVLMYSQRHSPRLETKGIAKERYETISIWLQNFSLLLCYTATVRNSTPN